MEYNSLQFEISNSLAKGNHLEKNNRLEVTLYNLYTFSIPLNEIQKIAPQFSVGKNNIQFQTSNQQKAERRFTFLLSKYITRLKNKVSGFPAVYVHKNSGISLFGLQFLGIVDKGSEMIEVKPITNCNMSCIFCSVDEGPDTSKQVDFVVEEDYLVAELGKLLEFKKKHNPNVQCNLWINPHGEPLLYAPIVSLAQRIAAFKNVGEVHIITNGVLLNKPLIDALAQNKKIQLNISISGFDDAKAKQMMGSNAYSITKVLEMTEYAAKKMQVTVTPVYVAGYNDDQLAKIIVFANKVGCKIAIQKFCYNKFGRNPIKESSWDEFFSVLQQLEEKQQLKLLGEFGKLQETRQFPKAFKKNEIVLCELVSPARMKKDKICTAKGFSILVPGCEKESGKLKVKITQDKYNLYIAAPLRKY